MVDIFFCECFVNIYSTAPCQRKHTVYTLDVMKEFVGRRGQNCIKLHANATTDTGKTDTNWKNS